MRAPAVSSAPGDLRAFFALGVSFAAATRDERMVVEITRCAAVELTGDGQVRVAVPLPEGRRTLANLDTTGVIALSAALPTDYSTVQLKGSDARRVDWPEIAQAAAAHRARFEAMMLSIGLSALHGAIMWSDSYVAIAFTPSALFDQTPGPGAGLPYAP
ncbi:MAG: hypothetical protein ABW252_03945 [Polyangiales bacterium]